MKKDTTKIFILLDEYYQDNENYVNVFSTYEKAKEAFDYVLNKRRENGYFNNKTEEEYIIEDNYCSIDNIATMEIISKEIDKFI